MEYKAADYLQAVLGIMILVSILVFLIKRRIQKTGKKENWVHFVLVTLMLIFWIVAAFYGPLYFIVLIVLFVADAICLKQFQNFYHLLLSAMYRLPAGSTAKAVGASRPIPIACGENPMNGIFITSLLTASAMKTLP